MSLVEVTASITAQNTFSNAFVRALHKPEFNFSLSGTWVATVTLQRSFDNGATWVDVDIYSANTELKANSPQSDVQWRFGVKTGDFTSGTVVGRLSQ